MTNTDNFIKGVFAISSITLAVLVILSSIAIISQAGTIPGAVNEQPGFDENIVPTPAIMIDHPEMINEDGMALAYSLENEAAVQFIEFPPMYISAQPLLNN